MKFFRSSKPLQASAASPAKIDRRGLVLGVGAAGAAAVAAQALRQEAVAVPLAGAGKAAAEAADGYQVTAHVLRYYETAKV
jgi:siroheme synthase (precorrin-2 oxidase/ferrochelatase)